MLRGGRAAAQREQRVNNTLRQPLTTLRNPIAAYSTLMRMEPSRTCSRPCCICDKIVGEAMSVEIGGSSEAVTWQSGPFDTRFWP